MGVVGGGLDFWGSFWLFWAEGIGRDEETCRGGEGGGLAGCWMQVGAEGVGLRRTR